MVENERIEKILALLQEHYFDKTKCYLNHENPWQLLFATIMSAQCTDDRVNMVTKDLFKKYQTLEDFASVSNEALERDIRSTGFYRNKAKSIINCARQLLERHNGEVPSDIDELTKLSGVGRKTANVIRGHIFRIDSIVVDTHVKRISRKLGFTENNDPVKIEFDLMKVLPKESWIRYNQQVIAHGRQICVARRPKCDICFLRDDCPGVYK